MAINVFLGVYQPGEDIPDIWDLTTDYYLHHTMARVLPSAHSIPNHTKWWDSELIDTLPLPLYRGECGSLWVGVASLGPPRAFWWVWHLLSFILGWVQLGR
jgi:hypothetical protein